MEIKYRPCPFTYITRKYVRIAKPFYFRGRNWKTNTPERSHKHQMAYINRATSLRLPEPSALLEVEATAPSKTDSASKRAPTQWMVSSLTRRS